MRPIICITVLLLLACSTSAQEKLPVIVPYHYQNIRELYLDSANHHTALKTILHEDSSGLYDAPAVKKGWIYRKLFQEHLFEFRQPDFNVFIDFLPDFTIGKSSKNTTWLNTRGAQIRANVGKNFYFESSFFENQGRFPAYLDSFIRKHNVVPGQGEIRDYANGKAFDFAYVNALLSYTPNKYLNVTLGYGTNSIGDGYRSLILSDIAFSYPYLKITGTLGNVQYTSMWAQFQDLNSKTVGQAYSSVGYDKKWGVFHFLDWNVSKKLTIGLFDAVIWPDSDSSTKQKRGFDWTYMNPIIFLRPAEFSVGSSDNAMIGLNTKFKVFKKTTLYGQLMLDEFKLKEFFGGKNWWGNKWSTQLGFRSFDLFKVPRLDVQGELNIVRPYTYSFRNSQGNYAHSNQSLAHPMGANFKEVLGLASYTYKRWLLRGQLTYAKYGMDAAEQTTSYGKDIFKPYTNRVGDYDIKIGQGIPTTFTYAQGSIAYVLNPKYNLRLEVSAANRHEKNDLNTTNEFIFSFGLRSTFRQLYYDF